MGAGMRDQGAVHVDLPAEFPVGPRAPAGSGEPLVATGDDRFATGYGYTGQRGYRCWPWPLARRADGTAAPGTGQHGTGRGPLPAGKGAPCRCHGSLTMRADIHPRHGRRLPQGDPLDSTPYQPHRDEAEWTPIPYRAADVAADYTPFESKPDAATVRLIRRVKPTPGSQLACSPTTATPSSLTGRAIAHPEADHRRHAEIERHPRPQVRRGAQPSPLGLLPANAAWLAVQVMGHNLARWTAHRTRRATGNHQDSRRRFFSLAGRLTRSARRLTLHLPQGSPQNQFGRALARLRALPLPF